MKLSNLIAPKSRIFGCGMRHRIRDGNYSKSNRRLCCRHRAGCGAGKEGCDARLECPCGLLCLRILSDSMVLSIMSSSPMFWEHLPNPAEIVIMAKEGLRPGGSVLVSVPNVAHWFVRMDLLVGRFNYQDCGTTGMQRISAGSRAARLWNSLSVFASKLRPWIAR